ncbi:MAG: threonine/serine dehydratase [Candidatus Limnocylindrales bacterium]|jgi:threonine dehydratase
MLPRKPGLPEATASAPSATASATPGPGSDPLADESALVTIDAIRAAADVIRGVVLRTLLLPFGEPRDGDPSGGTRAWLKPESLQPIGAFKLRGAYYNIATLSAERRAGGVVAHSSGNHAQGVARAARLLGVRAVIVMPSDAPRIKVERVREDGAEIVFVGPSSEERAQRAAELARVEGLAMVAPYDDAATITGQGTVGLEIVEQLAALDELGPAGPSGRRTGPVPFTVLVPVGGGGIASGVAVAVKSLRPDAVVVGVEPALAADARDSLAEGRIVTWSAEMVGRTIADGQRTTHIGHIPFALLSRYLDAILTVTDDEIARAMVRASREARLVLEPSGATTLAAWLFHADELPARGRVVAILSGGNVDPARYDELLARGVAAGG